MAIKFPEFFKTKPPARTKKLLAYELRSCKKAYCSTDCAKTFTFIKGSDPKYRKAPDAAFVSSLKPDAVARLRAKGATSACLYELSPFSLTNPRWNRKK